MVIAYTGDKGEPEAVPSGAAPTFAADITEIMAWLASGRSFRKPENWAALVAATGMEDNDIAIVDTIDGAWFKYDSAATTWRMHGIARFDDVSARNTALPSPAAGMQSRRADATYVEEYFTSADPDGWYPIFGDLPRVRVRRAATQSLSGSWALLNAVWGTPAAIDLNGFTYSAGAFTCAVAGLYSVEAFLASVNSNQAFGMQVVLNSTSVDTAATIAVYNSTSAVPAGNALARNDLQKLAVNDVIRVYALGGSSQSVGTTTESAKLNIAYRGPSA